MTNFNTRKPTGRPSFPLVLMSGVEGSGKTWAAAEATGMEAVGRAFFIEVGESMADEYGNVPGADFEIIEHNGTLGQIKAAVDWAAAQEVPEGQFNLLIVDSMTALWELCKDNAQNEQDRRARQKSRKPGGKVDLDIWGAAKDMWQSILNGCRRFPGPVLITARLKKSLIADDHGNLSKYPDWKIESEKNLPYNVQVVLQARAPRQWTMTKIATTSEALRMPPGGEMTFNDFSVKNLLEGMGIDTATQVSTYVPPAYDDSMGGMGGDPRVPDQPVQGGGRRNAPAPEQQQQEPRAQVSREELVAKFADNLLEAEKKGDLEAVARVKDWASQRNDEQLTRMAAATYDRMMKPPVPNQEPAENPQTVQEVLDGELVN